MLPGLIRQKFRDKRVLQWLRHLARRGVKLGGVSGGPVILAAAGLMNGYRMTVHWEHAPSLVEISPSLQLEKSIFVIDRDRYTCAGGIAALDMMHETDCRPSRSGVCNTGFPTGSCIPIYALPASRNGQGLWPVTAQPARR